MIEIAASAAVWTAVALLACAAVLSVGKHR